MAIEAELKAHVHDPDRVCRELEGLAEEPVEIATYRDVYYDLPSMSLDSSGREFRLRRIETDQGSRAVLTIKAAAVDAASDSKPEYETDVSDPEAVHEGIGVLGYIERTRLTKHCRNYRFTSDGWDVLATVVRLPEADGVFIEVETLVANEQVTSALGYLRDLLVTLGIGDADLTTEKYTDAVEGTRD